MTILSPTRRMIGLVEAALLQVPNEPKKPASQPLAGDALRSGAPVVPECGRQRDLDLNAVKDVGGGDACRRPSCSGDPSSLAGKIPLRDSSNARNADSVGTPRGGDAPARHRTIGDTRRVRRENSRCRTIPRFLRSGGGSHVHQVDRSSRRSPLPLEPHPTKEASPTQELET
jgi:hypothetical protein